jgi:hypothetical protein
MNTPNNQTEMDMTINPREIVQDIHIRPNPKPTGKSPIAFASVDVLIPVTIHNYAVWRNGTEVSVSTPIQINKKTDAKTGKVTEYRNKTAEPINPIHQAVVTEEIRKKAVEMVKSAMATNSNIPTA